MSGSELVVYLQREACTSGRVVYRNWEIQLSVSELIGDVVVGSSKLTGRFTTEQVEILVGG